MSCDRYGIDSVSLAACSGHGICVDGDCICDPGWTSVIDFWPDPYYDCDTNMLFVSILAWGVVLSRVVKMYFSLTNLWRLPSWQYSALNGSARMSLYWTIGACSNFLYGIPKILDPENVVGINVVSSFGFGLGMSCIYAGWAAFAASLIRFLTESSTMLTPTSQDIIMRTIKPFAKYLPYWEVAAFGFIVFPIAAGLSPNQGNGKILIAVHCYSFILLVGQCFILSTSISRFCSELEFFLKGSVIHNNHDDSESNKEGKEVSESEQELKKKPQDNKITQVLTRMRRLEYFPPVLLLTSPIYLALAASSLLRHKSQYFLMAVNTFVSIPEILALATQMKSKPASSSKDKYSSGSKDSQQKSTLDEVTQGTNKVVPVEINTFAQLPAEYEFAI